MRYAAALTLAKVSTCTSSVMMFCSQAWDYSSAWTRMLSVEVERKARERDCIKEESEGCGRFKGDCYLVPWWLWEWHCHFMSQTFLSSGLTLTTTSWLAYHLYFCPRLIFLTCKLGLVTLMLETLQGLPIVIKSIHTPWDRILNFCCFLLAHQPHCSTHIETSFLIGLFSCFTVFR